MMPLKKQLKIARKIKIKKFVHEQLWQYALITAFVFFCGWLFQKYVEGFAFCVSHYFIRPQFEKQFHCINNNRIIAISSCLFVTCTIIFFSAMYCLPLAFSLLSAIPLALFVCWFGYVLQDHIDAHIIPTKNIYEMTDTEFTEFGISKGLTDCEIMIADRIWRKHLKGQQLYNAIGYSKRQTIRLRKSILQKLNN